MVQRSLRSNRPRTTRRRKLIWARTAGNVVLGNGGLLAVAPLSEFETEFSSQLIGCTLMTVRGVITATLRGPTFVGGGAAHARARVAMRITDHADLAPQDYAIGAMYGNQAHADWFMFEPFCLDNAGTIAAAADEVDTTAASEIRLIHVKAMRKFQELGQTVELVIGAPPVAGPPTPNQTNVHVMWDFSLLIALP